MNLQAIKDGLYTKSQALHALTELQVDIGYISDTKYVYELINSYIFDYPILLIGAPFLRYLYIDGTLTEFDHGLIDHWFDSAINSIK